MVAIDEITAALEAEGYDKVGSRFEDFGYSIRAATYVHGERLILICGFPNEFLAALPDPDWIVEFINSMFQVKCK